MKTILMALMGKALDQPGLETVTGLEVAGHAPEDLAENVSGKVWTDDRRADQEPAQADDAVEIVAVPGVIPGDPALPDRTRITAAENPAAPSCPRAEPTR